MVRGLTSDSEDNDAPAPRPVVKKTKRRYSAADPLATSESDSEDERQDLIPIRSEANQDVFKWTIAAGAYVGAASEVPGDAAMVPELGTGLLGQCHSSWWQCRTMDGCVGRDGRRSAFRFWPLLSELEMEPT